MAAALAFQADICAKANHRPFVGAAGMWFTQTQEIVELEVGKHGFNNERAAADSRRIIPRRVMGA